MEIIINKKSQIVMPRFADGPQEFRRLFLRERRRIRASPAGPGSGGSGWPARPERFKLWPCYRINLEDAGLELAACCLAAPAGRAGSRIGAASPTGGIIRWLQPELGVSPLGRLQPRAYVTVCVQGLKKLVSFPVVGWNGLSLTAAPQ